MNHYKDKILYVLTGEVKTGSNEEILRSSAIGSCIVIVVYDLKLKIGGMAHIMLPGTAPENTKYDKTRYANNAVSDLIIKMKAKGAKIENIEFCVVGGANVLKRENDTIAQNNVNKVLDLLKKQNFKIKAKSVGGTERRSATLNIKTGKLGYTVGDGAEMILWNFLVNNGKD